VLDSSRSKATTRIRRPPLRRLIRSGASESARRASPRRVQSRRYRPRHPDGDEKEN